MKTDNSNEGEDIFKRTSRKPLEITGTWNPVTGCLHGCTYCWARIYADRLSKAGVKPYATRGFQPTFIEERLRKKFPKNSFILVSDMGDLFGEWVPDMWISKVMDVVERSSQASFLLLTKNPRRYLELGDLPSRVFLGATIESNRDYSSLSNAPPQSHRIEFMKKIAHDNKALVVEPILDFDLEEFTMAVKEVSPSFIYIGYDNYRCNLPEPPLEKTLEFIKKVSKYTEVRLGTIREAWNSRHSLQNLSEKDI